MLNKRIPTRFYTSKYIKLQNENDLNVIKIKLKGLIKSNPAKKSSAINCIFSTILQYSRDKSALKSA